MRLAGNIPCQLDDVEAREIILECGKSPVPNRYYKSAFPGFAAQGGSDFYLA